MLYNTNFEVKYHTIKHELLDKLEQSLKQDFHITDDININECGYTTIDVSNICEKLYRDELLSVFGLDFFISEDIIDSMRNVYNTLITNTKFKLFISEIKTMLMTTFIEFKEKSQDVPEQLIDISDNVLLLSLFSENVFYITHKCICQHMQLNTIDDILLFDMRKALLDYFGINNC